MKKTILLLTGTILFTLFSIQTKAQFSGTFSIQAVVGLPDTVSTNATYSFGFRVANVGNTIYSGTIDFDFLVDSINPGSLQSFGVWQVGGFAPGDSVIIPVSNYAFSLNTFNLGDNVVVVWPRGLGNSNALDSLTFHVYVTNLSGINENEKRNSDLRIFPNPSKDIINFTSEKNMIDEVRIYDVSGRLALESKSHLNIFTAQLTEGVYIAEVKFSDGIIIRRKIMAGSVGE